MYSLKSFKFSGLVGEMKMVKKMKIIISNNPIIRCFE